MSKSNLDKKIIKDKIAMMIRDQQVNESVLEDMSIKQLIEEISIYHQELLFQNDELLQRSLELEAEKARYQGLFEDSPVAYAILDRDFFIQSFNRTFSGFFDDLQKEFIRKPISAFVHPNSQDELYFSFQELGKTGKSESRVIKLAAGNLPIVTNLVCNRYEYMGKEFIRAAFVDITKEYHQREKVEKALKEKNDQYELAIMGSSAGIWDWDLRTDRMDFSRLFREQLGYDENELPFVVSTLVSLIHPEDKEIAIENIDKYFQHQNDKFNMELRMLHKNGSYRWFQIRGQALWDTEGNPYRMAGSTYDIHDSKAMEVALRLSEEKYRLITENISDVISIFNLDKNRYIFFSPSIEELTGYTVEEALAVSLGNLIHPDYVGRANDMKMNIEKAFSGNRTQTYEEVNELQIRHKNGSYLWVEILNKAKRNPQGEIEVLGVIRNVNKRKEAELEVEYLSYHDNLTGLYNRHFFDKKVFEEMAKSDHTGEPLSMIILDLDFFKVVNDTWGHPVGDAVLKRTAEIIQSQMRKEDVLARLGGEEFVVLMKGTAKSTAYIVAEKIRQAMQNNVHPIAGAVTVSLGVAQRLPLESFISFYKRLDDALYEAKKSGRNRTSISDASFVVAPIIDSEWSSDWDSGNQELDNQHKELMKISNALVSLAQIGSEFFNDIDFLGTVIRKMEAHFNYEEKLLSKVGYPDYNKHWQVHRSLMKCIEDFMDSCREGKLLTSKLLSFVLDEYIMGHILVYDALFFPYTRMTR